MLQRRWAMWGIVLSTHWELRQIVSSPPFASHLNNTDLFSNVSISFLSMQSLRCKADQKPPVEHNVNCRPPFEQAPYIMPAPFHPANRFPVPSSIVSPTFPLGPPGMAQITPPQSHESSGNIVFGGFPGSAGPSPVLPPSPSAMTFLPRSFPNWAPPHPQQHFPNHHFPHVHAPHPSLDGHIPHYAHPQPNIYDPQRQTYAFPPPGYHHRMPSFYPPENHFPYTPPPGTPFINSFPHGPLSNGGSFSTSSIGSHSISGSADLNTLHPARYSESVPYSGPIAAPEQNASQSRLAVTDEGAHRSHSRGYAQLPVDSAAQQDGQVNTQELGNVSNYLLSQFNRKALADCCLRLSHSHNKFKARSFYLHRLLIARSPLLASLISSAGIDAIGCKRLHLDISGDFVRPDAFELALLHLYGVPLLDDEFLVARDFVHSESSTTSPDKSLSSNIMAGRLEFAICYAAAGNILQLPGVKRRGEEIVTKLISWETLERGITLAMNGGRGSLASSSHPCSCAPSRKSSSCSTASRNSNKENSAIRIPCESHSRDEPNQAHNTCKTLADGLLRDISQYIGTNFPSDFQLQTSAPSLPIIDRLPSTAESRTFSNPRLSSLQFGDHPSEEAQRPNPQSLTLSQILLSVPFPVLDLIFEHLTPDMRAQHAQGIIEERERRRDRALRSKSVPWASRLVGGAPWQEAGWEESVGVVPTEAGRNVRLARRWTGLRRPTRTRARGVRV